MALSLVGGAFAFTGCTDYEDDINKLNDRLDALETGTIADVQEQMTTLQSALDQANQTISGLEGNVNDLSGALETLQGSVDGLGGTVDGLQGAVNAIDERLKTVEAFSGDIDALKAAVEEITASLGDYATKDDVAATYATKEAVALLSEKLTAVESQLTDFAAEMTSLSGRVSSLEGKDAELDAAIAAVKTTAESAVAAAAKAQETADNALKTAQDALGQIASLKEALKTYATKGELEAAVEKIDSLDSAIDDELAAKLDASEFNAKFDEALKSAIEDNDGMVNQAIAQAIADATDEYNKNLDEVKARVNALVGKVEDLAKRIQSLVFVPEYNDDNATLSSYTMFGESLTETATITATFKVTPVEYADQLVAQASDVAFVQLLPVKTRAAAASVNVASENVTITKGEGEGYVNVEAIVPISDLDADADEAIDVDANGSPVYRVALYVADPSVVESVEEDPNKDINDIDAGSYISSEYVGLALNETKVNENYVLYNSATKDVFDSEDAEVSKSYLEAPAEEIFYEGYVLCINFGSAKNPEYLTLDEAAARIGLETADAITPEYEVKVDDAVFTQSPNAPANPMKPADLFEVSAVESAFGGPSIAMAQEVEVMKNYVGAKAEVSDRFYFVVEGDFGVSETEEIDVLNNDFSYTVTNEQYSLKLDSRSVDWTYATAVELSSARTVANRYDKPIVFKEVSGELVLPENVKLSDVLGVAPTKSEVTLNGEVVENDVPVLTLTDLASEEARIATVKVSNYDFAKGEVNVYNFKNTYSLGGEVAIDFTVEFELTLGAAPSDQEVDLGTLDVNYTPKEYRHAISTLAEAYDVISSENSAFFENEAEFMEALNEGYVSNNTILQERNGEIIDQNVSRLRPMNSVYNATDKVYEDTESEIFFAAGAMTKIGDKFEYKTQRDTWFGVSFIFSAKADVVKPAFTLAYADNMVFDGVVTLNGKLNVTSDNNDTYTLDEATLSDYFVVRNYNVVGDYTAAEIEDMYPLSVKFEVVEKAEDYKGYVIPAIGAKSASTVTVDENFGYGVMRHTYNSADNTVQLTYPYQTNVLSTVHVKASLMLEGIAEPISEQTITITSDDPIEYEDAVSMDVYRVAGSSEIVNVNVWDAIKVYAKQDYTYSAAGTDRVFGDDFAVKAGDQINLVNANQTTLANMFLREGVSIYDAKGKVVKSQNGLNAENAYKIDFASEGLGFDPVIAGTAIDGTPVESVGGVSFDATTGVMTYDPNNSTLGSRTLNVTVKFAFTNFLGNNEPKVVEVTVNFKEAAADAE